MGLMKSRRIRFIAFSLRLLERYLFDPKLKRMLRRAISNSKSVSNSKYKNLIFFDIGANRGQTIRLLKSMYPESCIYSFEPDPVIFSNHLSLNKWQGVQIFNLALGDSAGRFPFWVSPIDETSTLYLPDTNSAWNKKKALLLGLTPETMYERIEVDVVRLDEFISRESIDRIDLLKIDVEGGELQVLQGASTSIKSGIISVVQFESHDDDLRPSQKPEIEDFLLAHGFYHDSSVKHAFGDFHDEIWVKYIQ